MTREEISEQFALNIEKERMKLGFTQLQMSKALEMSLSSYKNMINGISTNIPIYVAHRVYHITGKFLFELCGEETPETFFLANYRKLPSHIQNALLTMSNIEVQLTSSSPSSLIKTKQTICLYIPTGNMTDGMLFDSNNIKPFTLQDNYSMLGNRLDCALQITSNHFHPVYHTGDILLICQQPPRDGDTGIFIHRPTRQIYIRKFCQTNPCRLEPITDYGQTIYVDGQNDSDMSQWIKFGYVLTKYR